MPDTTFQDDLKAFRGLKLKTFEKESTDVITNARKFLKYIDQVQETFTSLMISNPERQVKVTLTVLVYPIFLKPTMLLIIVN